MFSSIVPFIIQLIFLAAINFILCLIELAIELLVRQKINPLFYRQVALLSVFQLSASKMLSDQNHCTVFWIMSEFFDYTFSLAVVNHSDHGHPISYQACCH